MIKKVLFVAAVLLVLISAGLYYVNKVLMPVHVKGLVIKGAKEALNRQVTLDAIELHPLKGIVVSDLSIFSKDKPEEIFVHVKEASAQVLLLPLLQKKVIVSSLRVEGPSVRLVRFDEQYWNFSDLLTPKKSTTSAPFDLLVSGISIIGGRVKVEDLSGSEPFSELLDPVNLKGSLSLNAGINLSGEIGIPATKGSLRFEARGTIKDNSYKADLKVKNLILTRYLRFSPGLPAGQALRALSVTDAQLTLFLKGSDVTLSGTAMVPDLDANPAEGVSLKGSLGLNKIFFTVKGDGAVSFQGGVAAEKAIVLLPEGRSFEGNLRASFGRLRFNKGDIDVAGSLSSDISRLRLREGMALSGTLKTNDAAFSLTAGKIAAQADLEVKDLDLTVNGQRVTSNISVPRLIVAPGEQGFTAQADIHASSASLTLSTDQKIAGDVMLNQATLVMTGSDILLKTNAALSRLSVEMPGLSATGSITAPGFSASLRDQVLEAASQLTFKDTALVLNKATRIAADPQITFHGRLDPRKENGLSYDGQVDIAGGVVTGVPSIDNIESIHGRVAFETDHARTSGLSLNILGTPVEITGELTNFAAPQIDAELKAAGANLAVIERVIPDIIKEHGLKITGAADASARVQGAAADLSRAKILAKAELKDVAVESTKLRQKIEKAAGTISYTTPTLSWKDLSLIYEGKNYLLNGYLQDFVNPFVAGSLKTDNIQADFQLKKDSNDLKIERMNASYFDSSVEGKGVVKLPAGPDEQIAINITSDLKLSLRDLPKMLPQPLAKDIDALKLAGILKIRSTIKGSGLDWMQWNSNFTVETPALYVMGYQAENLVLKGEQKGGQVAPLTLTGKFYSGEVDIKSEVDLTGTKFPFETSFDITGVDLAQLKRVTPIKDQQISGALDTKGQLKGEILDIREVIGQAKVNISGGRLWETAILSNILSIVSTSFQGGDIVITDATATLKFEHARVMTDDMLLKGNSVSIQADGWIDWDQHIELNVTPRIEAAPGATDTAALLSAINPTSGLVNIHVGGTFAKPVIEHNLSAPTLIKKTLQNTVGGLLKLFE